MKNILILLLVVVLSAVAGTFAAVSNLPLPIKAVIMGVLPILTFAASVYAVEGVADYIKHRKHIKALLKQEKQNIEQYNTLYNDFRGTSVSQHDARIKTEQHLLSIKQSVLDAELDTLIEARINEIDKAEEQLTALVNLK